MVRRVGVVGIYALSTEERIGGCEWAGGRLQLRCLCLGRGAVDQRLGTAVGCSNLRVAGGLLAGLLCRDAVFKPGLRGRDDYTSALCGIGFGLGVELLL